MLKSRILLIAGAAAIALGTGAVAMAQSEDEALADTTSWRALVIGQLRLINEKLGAIAHNTEERQTKLAPIVIDFRVGQETAGIEPIICWNSNRTDTSDMCENAPTRFCNAIGYRFARHVRFGEAVQSNPRSVYVASMICSNAEN